MLKVKVTVKADKITGDPSILNDAFTKKNMPKLYRYIEVATKAALKDKDNLPHYDGQVSFYDDARALTGKTGVHLVSQYQTRTETGADGENLIVSNKKTVKGGWNVFWMLNEGTRDYTIDPPKFMRFYDRYAMHFRKTRTRAGNYGFTSRFNTYIEKCAQLGVDNAVQTWEMSGAAQSEFAKLLKKAGFNVVLS